MARSYARNVGSSLLEDNVKHFALTDVMNQKTARMLKRVAEDTSVRESPNPGARPAFAKRLYFLLKKHWNIMSDSNKSKFRTENSIYPKKP